MSLFYAYLKQVHNDEHWRCLITFVDRETADEWWRMISTPPSPYAGNVKRVSPQFYVQDDPNHNNVLHFFNRSGFPNVKQFLEKMFFTLLNDRDGRILSIAPPIKITDHISGRWYYIRSKADPQRRWYCRVTDDCLVCGDLNCNIIHVSTEYHTRFRVEARNLAIRDFQPPRDFVMVGRDEVSIGASRDRTLQINDVEDLRATTILHLTTSDLFLFNDLKNRFVIRTKKQGDGRIWEYVKPVERGSGEAWELVD